MLKLAITLSVAGFGSQELGVSRPTLYNWKNQLLSQDAVTSIKRHKDSPPSSERVELEQQIESLRRDIRRLQLEQDLLKKANELLKKDSGIDLQFLTNREKTQLVDALSLTYPLTELLLELGLPRSSYFYHRARLQVADKYLEARRVMIDIFERNYRCYGYRRMHASRRERCVHVSEKVVQRLMKQERLVAGTRRRRRYGSYMGEIGPAPENLMNRDFSASAPNEKWLTDVTEFQIPAGKVYLSPMIDCFDGMVVSWSIGTRPDAALVNAMLDAAIEKVATSAKRPVVHSDRGAHYRWPGWLTRIADAKLVRSMSRKGCSPDNAACEGFFGRLKTELFYSRNWLSTTIEEFVATVDSCIRWYNDTRIKMSLGFRSPIASTRPRARFLTCPSFLPHPQGVKIARQSTATADGCHQSARQRASRRRSTMSRRRVARAAWFRRHGCPTGSMKLFISGYANAAEFG